jgi:hypothetical protein
MMKTGEFLYKSIGRITQMLPIKQFTDLTELGHSMLAWKNEPRQILQLSHKMHGRDEKKVFVTSSTTSGTTSLASLLYRY